MKALFAVLAAAAAFAARAAYSGIETDLKKLAVRWDDGGVEKFVLGTAEFGANWWDNKKESVYDGFGWYTNDKGVLTNQGYFEYGGEDESWSGYQVCTNVTVTRIRFLSAIDPEWQGRPERTIGCCMQGANTADFSDAVTLYTVSETFEELTNGWIEVQITDPGLLSRTFTYLRFYAPAGKHGGSIAEVEFYGVDSLVRGLSGTPIDSGAEEGHDASAAFDRDSSTYYRSAANGGYLGLDLGSPRSVCGIRFIPEDGQTWRTEGGRVQISDDPAFGTYVEACDLGWDKITNGVATTRMFDTVVGRYVRFVVDENRQCSLAEIEFIGTPGEAVAADMNFALTDTGNADGTPTVSWSVPAEFYPYVSILRSSSAYGPFAEIARAGASAASWTDASAVAGVKYHYMAELVEIDAAGAKHVVGASGVFAHRGLMQLDRDGTGALRPGRAAIGYHHTYGDSDETTAAALFDGDVSTYSDYVNTTNGDVNLDASAAGIDFGERCVIERFSVYPRADNVARLHNMQLCGYDGASDTSGYAWRSSATAISERFGEYGEYVWYEFSTSESNAVQCAFLMNNWGWGYANAAELRLYGYSVDQVARVPLGAESVSCEWKDWTVSLSWENCNGAESYRVERLASNSDEWVTLADGLAGTAYVDTTTKSKYEYQYRIVTVRGDASANSAAYSPAGTRRAKGVMLTVR